MGYNIAAHIARAPVDPKALHGLGVSWKLYRDDAAQAWVIDAQPSKRGASWPFADIDGTLRKEGAHVAPELSTALARLKLKDMFLAADLALNLRLSQRLEQDVLSFVADDEGVDMACQSKDGVMQMIEQRLFDATVRWTLDQGLTVQPHTLDEEPDEELTDYETILDGLARTKILPRGGGPPNQLHGVSARAERDFLAGNRTFLDVGSFDHSTRIPAPLAEGR